MATTVPQSAPGEEKEAFRKKDGHSIDNRRLYKLKSFVAFHQY